MALLSNPSGSLDLTIYWGRKLVPHGLAAPTPEWISVKRVSEETGVVPDLFTWGDWTLPAMPPNAGFDSANSTPQCAGGRGARYNDAFLPSYYLIPEEKLRDAAWRAQGEA